MAADAVCHTGIPSSLPHLSRHVWRGSVLLCVITMPRDRARCDGCEASLVAAGFPPPLRLQGQPRRGQEPLHHTVTRAHRRVLYDFVLRRLYRHWHLLLLEDDARIAGGAGSGEMLWTALGRLEQAGGWTSLHVGHVPIGPCLPIGSHLCHTTLPYCAHAILYNRHRFPNINPVGKWGRPWFFEGMLSVPVDERFAMLPSIAYQSVTPKEMRALPLVRHVTYRQGEAFMTALSLAETLLIVAVALSVCVAGARRMATLCRA